MKSMEYYDEIVCANCHFSPICLAAREVPQIKTVVDKVVHAKQGDKVCRANQKFHSYYVIHSGMLKSSTTKADSKEYIGSFYFEGDVIGFEAIYKNKFESTIDAVSEAKMCVVSSQSISHLLSYKPALHGHLLWLVSRQMNSKSYLAHMNAEHRLAGFLLEMIGRLNITDKLIKLPIKQIDIANHLSLTPETVNRVFHRWQDGGIIAKMRNKEFILPDISTLSHICW